MISLEEFLKNRAPRSKLDPWLSDLRTLRAAGCTYTDMARYLKGNDVYAYPNEIKRFLDRRDRAALPPAIATPTQAAPSNAAEPQPPRGPKPFQWPPKTQRKERP